VGVLLDDLRVEVVLIVLTGVAFGDVALFAAPRIEVFAAELTVDLERLL
jgi:hypothetical protein